uniref:Transmembrane protein 242 n=1 Tax=Trichogramma kaykai TaxID=54128 RepID=A0ABD2WDZ7_9HYME
MSENVLTLKNSYEEELQEKKSFSIEKWAGGIFVIGLGGIFFMSGFLSTSMAFKKKSPPVDIKYSDSERHLINGRKLATKALGIASLYSSISCGIIFLSIWKLSGASSIEDFRYKMRSLFFNIHKKDN